MKKRIVFVLCVVLPVLVRTSYGDIALPFADGFENISLNDYPNENGWQNLFSGTTAYVSDEQAHSGSRSLRLQSRPTWSRTDYVALPALPDLFRYEISVYPDANPPVRATWVGFPQAFGNQGPFYNRFNIHVWDGSRGEVIFTPGIPGSAYTTVGEFTVGTWVTVRADLDFTSLTADLWLNGELAVTDVEITPREFHHAGFGDVTLNKFGATEYNWTAGAGTGVIYIDDVRLSVIPAPGAVLLGMIGLSVAGVKLRKHL
ncbi:MAG: hypothetical protein ACYSWQ_17920 [Planctomycetota bacterium]|jgi:hypothetical protein